MALSSGKRPGQIWVGPGKEDPPCSPMEIMLYFNQADKGKPGETRGPPTASLCPLKSQSDFGDLSRKGFAFHGTKQSGGGHEPRWVHGQSQQAYIVSKPGGPLSDIGILEARYA